MATGDCDPPLKNQPSPGIIEQRLARGDCLKAAGYFALMIDIHLHSRNGSRSMPKIGFHPLFAHALRLNKPHLRTQQSLAVSHELLQFTKSGARAGTAWVQKHHQFGLPWITKHPGIFWPMRRGNASSTGSLRILRHQQASREYHQEPDHGDGADFQCSRAKTRWPHHRVRCGSRMRRDWGNWADHP